MQRRALRGGVLLAAVVAVSLVVVLNWAGESSGTLRAGPPPPTPTPTPDPAFNAVAKVISDSADLIGGPMSRGRLGDLLLANTKIQVVIQQPQRNLLSVGQFGGQIIDADLVRAGLDPERDSFEEWAFGINLENTCHYTKVNIVNSGSTGQPAVIRATGVDDLLDFINPSSQVAGFGFPFPVGFDDVDLPVTCSTDYTLAPNSDFVRVDTTITNTSTSTISTFLTEFMNASGDVETFLPGYGFGEPLITASCSLCNYVAWEGRDTAAGVSYGYIHNVDLGDVNTTDDTTSFNTAGVTIPLLDGSAALALTGFTAPNASIPASGQIIVTRYFAVGDGDVGAIVDIRNQILGLSTGTLQGQVTRNALPLAGADVTVLGAPVDGPGSAKNVVAHYRTDSAGNYQGTLPPGNYTVHAQLNGHMPATPDPATPVKVNVSSTTIQNFTVPVAGRVRVTIVDEASAAIAGKVSIVGFDPYVDPGNSQTVLTINVNTSLFSNPTGTFSDSRPYGVTKVLFADQTGDTGEFFIEPGSYQVVVSHGTEYSVSTHPITVTAGALTTVNAQVAHVIDTTGFVSGEFHIHQIDSPDSEITKEERVVSILAEGVDFFTPSDHEHRTDIGPVIASLGAGGLVSAAVNNENTTPDYGHFNAWPLTTDPTKVNNGALDWASAGGVPPPAGQDFPSFGNYNMPPSEIITNLNADPGVEEVHINHIDSFFGPGGLSVDTAFAPPRDFANNASKRLNPAITNLFPNQTDGNPDDDFTGMEIWQGVERNDISGRLIARNLGDWFNLINQGIVRTGLAVSDTHKQVSDQAGFPRTFLASATDNAGALDDSQATLEGLAGNVNAGRSIGTDGPFVRVTASTAFAGNTGGLSLDRQPLISINNDVVNNATINVNIQSPLWAEFDRIEYYVNDVPLPNYYDNDTNTPPFWTVTPFAVHNKGVDFTVNTVPVAGSSRLEATDSLPLTGLTEDTWVVVLVRGTDGVSKPLFPVVPDDLQQSTNTTLANLTDGNLNELGVPATAFSNPLFISVLNDGDYDPHPVDNDRDGCTNDEELQPASSASDGGGRSPSSIWDVYDTDTENLAGVGTHLQGAVFVGDIIKIVQRFGTTGSPAIDPLSDASGSGYHTRYDRGGPIMGQNPWNLKPPNGSITIADIVNVVTQFGHNCL